MNHELHKEYEDGQLIRLTLGIPQVDSFLEMVRASFTYNTWINYAHDLKTFVNGIQKPILEVIPGDIFDFIRRQQRTAGKRRPQKVISFVEGAFRPLQGHYPPPTEHYLQLLRLRGGVG